MSKKLILKSISASNDLATVHTRERQGNSFNDNIRIVNKSKHYAKPKIFNLNLDVYNFIFQEQQNRHVAINIFRINDFHHQSNITSNLQSEERSYLEQTLTSEANQFMHIAQVNNFILGMSKPTTSGFKVAFTSERLLKPITKTFDNQEEIFNHIFSEQTAFDNEFFKEYKDMPITVGIYPSRNHIRNVYEEQGNNREKENYVKLGDEFYPRVVLEGVKFNYITEFSDEHKVKYDHHILEEHMFIRNNGDYDINDYAKILIGFKANYGDPRLYSNSCNMKNMYNPDWDVNTEINVDLKSFYHENRNINNNPSFNNIRKSIGTINSATIHNVRKYEKLGVSSLNTIWASYKCDNIYSNNEPQEYKTTRTVLPRTGTGDEFLGNLSFLNQIWYRGDGNVTINDNFSRKYIIKEDGYVFILPDTQEQFNKFQFIERIYGWNKVNHYPHHKSNFYSLILENTGFNNNIEKMGLENEDIPVPKIKKLLQSGINSIIKRLLDKITPIHTQLIDIHWIGE